MKVIRDKMRVTHSKRGYFHSLSNKELGRLVMELSTPKGTTEVMLLKLALNEMERRQKEGMVQDAKKQSCESV